MNKPASPLPMKNSEFLNRLFRRTPTKHSKHPSMKFLFLCLPILLPALLCGCGTLASQLGEMPLPPGVARQIQPGLAALARTEDSGLFQGLFRDPTPPRQAVWLRENPDPPRRKTTSTYSRLAAKTVPVPMPTPTPRRTAAFSSGNIPPMPTPAPSPKRKPDGYEILGYGRSQNQ